MNKNIALKIIVILLLLTSKTESKQPNIILFYVDDLGWMDLSCQGSKFYETPQIDKLASEGMRFTQAYTAHPRCVPARYGVVTGKFPARGKVPGVGELRPEDFTIAEALKAGGYRTFFTGKWHLLFQEGLANMPEAQGFDVNVAGGAPGSPPTYFYPYRKQESTERGRQGLEKTEVHGLEDGEEGEYITDRLTDETIQFIEGQVNSNPDQPFFAYVSHYGVHTPFEAKPELIKKYEDKLKTMQYDLPEYEKTKNGDTKLRQDYPVYAAMIESVDESMGRITQTLKNLNIDNNTIIIFTADNGGLSSRGNTRPLATSNYPLKNGKGWLNEGGIREAFIVKWPGNVAPGTTSHQQTIGTDIYPTVLDMAGLPLRSKDHLDGESIVKALKGKTLQRSKPLFWHSPAARPTSTGDDNSSAYRSGDYKLIHWFDEDKIELFNLKEDIGETNDLSEAMPDKRDKLFAEMQALKTEVINWQPENATSEYDFESFPYEVGFESNSYEVGKVIAKYDGNESDSWIETVPAFLNRFWRGKFSESYTCSVTNDANSGNKAIKVEISTKVGETIKLRSVNIPEGEYNISFYAKTNPEDVGKAKIAFISSSSNPIALSPKYTRYTGTGQVKKNANGSTRLMLIQFSDTKETEPKNYTVFIDDIRIESMVSKVPDNKVLGNIQIYPNPANTKIKIKGVRKGDTIQITDLKGRVLLSKTKNVSKVNISKLKSKNYILSVKRKGISKSFKFRKQ